MMEGHQAGQEDRLVEVRTGTAGGQVVRRGAASPAKRFGCLVAFAAAMGLVAVALMVGWGLQFFVFAPSCNQNAPPPSDAARPNITCSLKKRPQEGIYDIFTADQSGHYLVYGWLKLPDVTNEEVVLAMTLNKDSRSIDTKTINKTEIFFFCRVLLASHMTISVHFRSAYTDSLFHVYKL